jgi:dihydropteroate synthase
MRQEPGDERLMAWVMPKILGVLNITADSFSDGGAWLDPAAALGRAHALMEAGADVVDLGAIASNPDALAVPVDEEIGRLDPVITALHARGAAVSVDSFRPATQLYALTRGVAFLNDIHGFPHPEVYAAIAEAPCRLIVMHSVHGTRGISGGDVPVSDIMETIFRFFEERLRVLAQAGIDPSRLILDPGMGYFLGAQPETSFAALAGLQRLRSTFGLPVLVGVSRKSFLRAVTSRPRPSETGAASLAAELYAALAGVDYIRTHDVAALRDGLRVIAAIKAQEQGPGNGL